VLGAAAERLNNLVQPDTLPMRDLLDRLAEVGIPVENPSELKRPMIVELYRMHVLPRPQRLHRRPVSFLESPPTASGDSSMPPPVRSVAATMDRESRATQPPRSLNPETLTHGSPHGEWSDTSTGSASLHQQSLSVSLPMMTDTFMCGRRRLREGTPYHRQRFISSSIAAPDDSGNSSSYAGGRSRGESMCFGSVGEFNRASSSRTREPQRHLRGHVRVVVGDDDDGDEDHLYVHGGQQRDGQLDAMGDDGSGSERDDDERDDSRSRAESPEDMSDGEPPHKSLRRLHLSSTGDSDGTAASSPGSVHFFEPSSLGASSALRMRPTLLQQPLTYHNHYQQASHHEGRLGHGLVHGQPSTEHPNGLEWAEFSSAPVFAPIDSG
jgi:hypothetical protein